MKHRLVLLCLLWLWMQPLRAEVGAHILSGNVFETRALDEVRTGDLIKKSDCPI